MAGLPIPGPEKKTVVVVGGGVGGSVVAQSLQFVANVVLIDQKEYFEIPWASMRGMVEPAFAERALVNHSNYLTDVQLIVSSATSIKDHEVLTADGRSVHYDYLVIATGHVESVPETRNERLTQYHEELERIKSAKTILIIGGGPTGVELAGEIAFDFPDKNVKLVHKGSRLLEFIGSKAARKAMDWLVSKNVEVILDQYINLQSVMNGVIETSSKETITFDCFFDCTGKPTGSGWIKETFLKKNMDLRGRLIVDEHLRVKGHTNVFAVGDITAIKEIKQGYVAQRHAQVTSKNLKMLLEGDPERKMKMVTYKPGFEVAIISLGRKDGVAQLPFITISGCIPGIIKSSNLFVEKTRKQLGLASNPVCFDNI